MHDPKVHNLMDSFSIKSKKINQMTKGFNQMTNFFNQMAKFYQPNEKKASIK